jgi:cell division septation protein DedD
MVSILDLQHQAEAVEKAAPAAALGERVETSEPPAESEEFEFVLGRRQVASLLFVASIILMICVAAAYMAGRSMSPKASPVVTSAVEAREPDPPPIVLNQEPIPIHEPPLFAEPKAGSVYIQMGAVEKGVSVIFAEGLRKRGLPAFVAPGPSEKIFRVLIGPLPDPAAYIKAKDTVDQIGLSTFARKFPN